ncbi:hypothetical protein VNO77_42177 [Canavalia gladiata]|uniref:Uncharacterized protein n=1 Tax=Canavalia gladiata TaxID=3824 RepID=A0AAN9JZS0_CANGL
MDPYMGFELGLYKQELFLLGGSFFSLGTKTENSEKKNTRSKDIDAKVEKACESQFKSIGRGWIFKISRGEFLLELFHHSLDLEAKREEEENLNGSSHSVRFKIHFIFCGSSSINQHSYRIDECLRYSHRSPEAHVYRPRGPGSHACSTRIGVVLPHGLRASLLSFAVIMQPVPGGVVDTWACLCLFIGDLKYLLHPRELVEMGHRRARSSAPKGLTSLRLCQRKTKSRMKRIRTTGQIRPLKSDHYCPSTQFNSSMLSLTSGCTSCSPMLDNFVDFTCLTPQNPGSRMLTVAREELRRQ